MADDRLLLPGNSPEPDPGGPTAAPTLQDLPTDLLEASSRRLQIAALVWSVPWSIGLLFNNLVAPQLNLPPEQVVPWGRAGNVVGGIGVVLSLALHAWTRRPGGTHAGCSISVSSFRRFRRSASGSSTSGRRRCWPGASRGSAR
jgi:hypothetical protein